MKNINADIKTIEMYMQGIPANEDTQFTDACKIALRSLEAQKVLLGPERNGDVCPECGYPKLKKSFEKFERCEGCDWTSETYPGVYRGFVSQSEGGEKQK